MRSFERVVPALRDLGFSELESRVYLALLRHGPQSGYALAKILAKANSNTYTALEALEHRGAVVVDEGSPRIYRAVDPASLLDALEREFRRQKARALEGLASLQAQAPDEGTYRLNRIDDVLERARTSIGAAARVVLLDAFPEALEALRDDLGAAKQRGVCVIVKAYAPADVLTTRTILHPNGADVVGKYDGASWLNLSADGREALISLLEPELSGVRHATWTRSPYVAWTYHCGLACELALASLQETALAAPATLLTEALDGVHDLLYAQARGYMDPSTLKGDESA